MTIAYRSSASGNAVGTSSVSVTKPAGLATGDLLICVAYLKLAGHWNDVVPPTGFETAAIAAFDHGWHHHDHWWDHWHHHHRGYHHHHWCGPPRMYVFYKAIVDASAEPASYLVSSAWNGGLQYGFGAFLLAYSGVGTGSPVVEADAHIDNEYGTYLHIDDVAVAKGGAALAIVGTYSAANPDWSTPWGYNEDYDSQSGNFHVACSSKTYGAPGHSGCLSTRTTLATADRRSVHLSLRVTNMPPEAPRLIAPTSDATLGPEMIDNQTMESGTTGWESNTAFGFYAEATLTRDSGQKHAGTYSLKAAYPTNPGKLSVVNHLVERVVVGGVYRLDGWVRVPAGSPDVRPVFIWLGAGTAVTAKDAWTQSTWYFTAMAENAFVGWETTTNPGTGHMMYLDDVSLRRVLNREGMIDRTVTQRFEWDFHDPDPWDTQSKFDLRYKLVSDTSWTTITRQVPYSYHDFAGNTFAAGDYEWQVRCYDQGGAVGPYSDSEYFSVGDPPAAPALTSPTDGGTVVHYHDVTWTSTTQISYQVRTVRDNAGSPDTDTVYTDTGEIVNSFTRTHRVAFDVNGRYEHVQVRIRFNGIWSAWESHRVQVVYTPPPVPTLTLTAQNAYGALDVAITNPAPGGGEPAVSGNEVWIEDDEHGLELRVAAVDPSTTWRYWTAVSGYDYTSATVKVKALGTDGTVRWSS